MAFLDLFLTASLVILGLMTALWLLSLGLRNSSIVDIFWGAGFVFLAWIAFALTPQGFLPRKRLVLALVTIWGLRLTLHIGIRNWGKPEDFRYANWRAENGPRWWWVSFFQVFLLQGFLMWVISSPILAAMSSGFPAILTPLDWLGASIWILGLFFEAAGDWQLTRFKANPANKGKLLTTGLWKYTRHPNYFGDAMQWWGFWIIAWASGKWWTIFSPIVMTWLLMKVSGVTMLERTMTAKPGYEEYMRRTSSFFPWFPRN